MFGNVHIIPYICTYKRYINKIEKIMQKYLKLVPSVIVVIIFLIVNLKNEILVPNISIFLSLIIILIVILIIIKTK